MNIVSRSNKLLPRVLIQVLPATIVALVAIGVFSIWVVNKTALNERHARLDRVAAQSSTALAFVLQNIIDTAHTLAGNDLVINSLVDVSERDRYVSTLFRSLRVPGQARASVTLADYRGRRIASNIPNLTYTDASWVTDVMDGRQLVETSAGGMLVAVPVSYSNLPEGIVVIQYDASGLADLMKLPIQADAYTIKTNDGGLVFSSNDAFTQARNADDRRSHGEDWIWSEASIAGFPDLRLLVGDSLTTALAPVERQGFFLLLAIFLSVAAVTAGIVVTAMKVVRPIVSFMEGVELVGSSGDLAYRMEPQGADEFRRLVGSFNNMMSQIETTTRSRDQVDSILNSMNEYMLVVSPRGRIRSGNRIMAQALGCNVEELAGLDISSFLSGDWDEVISLTSDNNSTVERYLTTQQGNVIPVLVSVSRQQQRDQKSSNLIVVLNDITQQNHAKLLREKHIGELESSNAELEQFAYIASHDLQEPLRKVQAFSDRLSRKYDAALDEQGQDYLTRMNAAAGRMQTLVNDLLSYSRVSTKAEAFSSVTMDKMIREVVADLDMRIEETGGRVEISDLPTIDAAPLQMHQLFQNLISNALKYHREDTPPVVKISCEMVTESSSDNLITPNDISASACRILVEDNGLGFEDQYAERIFGIFQRLHGRSEFEGTGIGLAICRKIAEYHGGTITARGCPGKGSTFAVTLPLYHQRDGNYQHEQ